MGRTKLLALALVLLAIVSGASSALPPTCHWRFPERAALVCVKLLPDFSNFDPFELRFVQNLYLKDCEYDNIPNNTFANLTTSLVTLNIECSNFTLEADAFADLTALKTLTVGKGVSSFPPGTLCDNLPSLTSVNLADNYLSTAGTLGLTSVAPSLACGSNWTKLSVANNSIKSLTAASGFLVNLQQLDTLNASFNGLELIAPGAFANLTSLKRLYLNNNLLLLMDKTTFNGVYNLELLDLSYNQLFSVSPLLLSNLTKLLTLSLRGNYIVMLHPGVFSSLTSLTSLDLRSNDLKDLTTSLKPLSTLSTLLLGSNKLKDVTFKTLGNLSSLHHLDLDNNTLIRIDKESFLITKSLTILSINNNNLKFLPAFVFTPTLLALYAANNSITKLDKSQFKLATELLFLDLSGNLLTEVNNSTFNNLTSLLKLDLSNNSIGLIQNSSFVNATSLKFLFLQNNNLTFEENISGNGTANVTIDLFTPLQHLIFLNLSTNQINRFFYSWFPSSLAYLSLSNNNITILPEYNRTEDPLPFLHTLDLSKNKITSLSVNQFPPSVINVILSSNLIESVSPQSFSALGNLEYLFLRNNVLATLPEMKIPSELATISLRDNPWLCDCRLAWLKENTNLPFVVYDIMAMKCKFLLNKTQEEAPLLTATSADKFLCSFKQDGNDTSKCSTSDGALFAECAYKCPVNCTCYHDITWKIVQVDCTSAGLVAPPSDVPDVVQSLYLDGNQLSTIPAAAFNNMMVLQSIYLNSSKIVTIEDDAFETTVKLETLNLGDNMLKKLSISVFDKLHNLTKLDLSFNQLGDLDSTIFAPLTSLQSLNLAGNQFTTLPVTSFRVLPQLQQLSLAGNPWSCECTDAQQIKEWFVDSIKTVVDIGTLQCTLTDPFTGVQKVTLNIFYSSRCLATSAPPTAVLLGAPTSQEASSGVNATVIAVTMCISIIVLVMGVLAFVYRNELKFSFERRMGIRLLDMNE